MTTGYLVYPTQQAALARSRAEATARGCAPGDVTQLWWEVREDPTTPGQWLVLLDDGRAEFAAGKLAMAERGKVAADTAVLAALVAATALDAPAPVAVEPALDASPKPGRVRTMVTAMLRRLGRGRDTEVA